jgi:hypothetical protein
MKKHLALFLLIGGILLGSSAYAKNKKILVFCKTAGFHHDAIKEGIAAIQKLGAENKFDVDSTVNSAKFTDANFKHDRRCIE